MPPRYHDRPLGSFGQLAAFSFHETKNLISGEGGALIINDPGLIERAEIIREKGTNRSKFFRGEVDKYIWVEVGSSYLPSDIIAAFLWAQFENAESLAERRRAHWNRYHEGLAGLERTGRLRRPVILEGCAHNAHLYYLLLPSAATRTALIAWLKKAGIMAPFHYVPLHSAPAGQRYGRMAGPLPITEGLADRLLRLPLWHDMTGEPDIVIDSIKAFFR
jgi:dTDP-4-amino-4,6-dideoxygalactose transaminase